MRVRNLTLSSIELRVINSAGTRIGEGTVLHEGFAVVRSTREVEIGPQPAQGARTVQILTFAANPDQLVKIHGGGGNGVPVDENDGDGNRLESDLKIRNETAKDLPYEVKDKNRAVVDQGEISKDDFDFFDAVADVGILAAGGGLTLEIWKELPPPLPPV